MVRNVEPLRQERKTTAYNGDANVKMGTCSDHNG